jgi:thymidine kinase
MLLHPFRGGFLELIVGPMFSGKSEELIRRVTRASIAKQRVQVFKPALDRRYHAQAVASHNGRTLEALAVVEVEAMRAALSEAVQVVAIDEGQFLSPELVGFACNLAESGRRVLIAGLDLDFRGEPFGSMPELLARAEAVTKLTAICVCCGAPATRTQRLIGGRPAHYDDPIILVGAAEAYEPRCRACHRVPRAERPIPLSAASAH